MLVLSHFGRPRGRDAKNSLQQVTGALGEVLGRPVAFIGDCVGVEAEVAALAPKTVHVEQLRTALELDPRSAGVVPSTKGSL